MDNKIFCSRPCKNYECELNKCHAPKYMYVEKGIYALCKKFVKED